MIRKSGHRFSEKIMLNKKIERDDDSKKSHLALELRMPRRGCKIARTPNQATPSCLAIAFIAVASSKSNAVTPPASWVARTTSTVL